MERREVSAGHVQRGGCGAGNVLDRGCVGVVVDAIVKIPAHNVPTLDTNENKDKKSIKPTTRTLQQLQPERKPTTAIDHKMGQSTQPCQDACHCTISQQECNESIQ